MARSEEALQRRAEKRQRTVEEQRKIDLENHKRQKVQQNNTPPPPKQQQEENTGGDPMKEIGAWKCPQCHNENFASRRWCNSKTCNEPRPAHIAAPPRRSTMEASRSRLQQRQMQRRRAPHPLDEPGSWICDSCGNKNFASRDVCYNRSCLQARPTGGSPFSNNNKKPNPRHDEATSKKLVWASQANQETMSKNQRLRKEYLQTQGEGMEPEDIERAKILIARDERKKNKRKKESSPPPPLSSSKGEEEEPIKAIPSPDDKSASNETKEKRGGEKSKRDKNKALRKLYQETGGKGMKPEDIDRAKQLLERDERKRKKRKEEVSSQ